MYFLKGTSMALIDKTPKHIEQNTPLQNCACKEAGLNMCMKTETKIPY